MKVNKPYKILFISKQEVLNMLIYLYEYKKYNYKELLYKELKDKRVKIEIDCYTGEVMAYKRGVSYLSKWRPTKIKPSWIKEIEHLMILDKNIIMGEIYDR